MDFREETNTQINLITSIDQHTISVNHTAYQHHILISNHSLVTQPDLEDINQLDDAHPIWQTIIDQHPEVVLIGTGHTGVFYPAHLFTKLIEAQIGYEQMSSSAASRTYNVLANENRAVTALIMI